MLSEDKIISKLKSLFPKYIGDDAAVLEFEDNKRYLLSTDILVGGVHFRTTYYSAEDLAHKALHVNLSDIAAMGASPQFVLLGVAIPKSLQQYAQDFFQHFAQTCAARSVTLIGGDITSSSEKMFISVTIIGVADPLNIKYRHAGQPAILGESAYCGKILHEWLAST